MRKHNKSKTGKQRPGLTGPLPTQIALRLAQLEARFEERWDSHDRQSEQQYRFISDTLGRLTEAIECFTSKFSKLPCGANTEKIKSNSGRIAWLWGLLIAFILVGVKVIFK